MSTLLGYRRIADGIDPPYDHGAYTSTHKRAPRHPPIRIAHTLSEITGPRLGAELVGAGDADLTRFAGGEALGERIVVTGRVLDEDGRPLSNALVEIWQANSAGRYAHDVDQHDAPLDPHFSGVGRVVTGADGVYRFATIKPAAYPWKNHLQRVASTAYSFQPLRPRFRDPPHHADVFSRRSAARTRSDLSERAGSGGARAAGLRVRYRGDHPRARAGLSLRYRFARP